jgi:hypothetical protein
VIFAKPGYAIQESVSQLIVAHAHSLMHAVSNVSVWCGTMEVVCSSASHVTCGCAKMTSLSIKHHANRLTARHSTVYPAIG